MSSVQRTALADKRQHSNPMSSRQLQWLIKTDGNISSSVKTTLNLSLEKDCWHWHREIYGDEPSIRSVVVRVELQHELVLNGMKP